MKGIFVDTSGWLMLVDGADPLHMAACRERDRWLEQRGLLLSTDFVMDETLTLVRSRLGLDAAEAWWELVDQNPVVLWEPIDGPRAMAARRWFFRYRDKSFSFTDCTSFVVMKERKVKRALASDRHFVQAGFEIAPRRASK